MARALYAGGEVIESDTWSFSDNNLIVIVQMWVGRQKVLRCSMFVGNYF